MIGCLVFVVVLGRMPVRRLIATTDVAAAAAQAQVHPGVAGFQAFFAAQRTRRDVVYLVLVIALLGACCVSSRSGGWLVGDFQKTVQCLYDLRALADRRANALDRTGTHVANREYSRHR